MCMPQRSNVASNSNAEAGYTPKRVDIINDYDSDSDNSSVVEPFYADKSRSDKKKDKPMVQLIFDRQVKQFVGVKKRE